MSVGHALGACFVGVLVGASMALAVAPSSSTEPDKTQVPAKPTAEGAVTAAAAYLEALSFDVLLDDERRRQVIEQRATPAAVDELEERLRQPVQRLHAVAEAPVVARRAILGYRVEDFTGSRATVSIWGMALFASGIYDPTTQWSTSHIQLEWHHGRWLITAVESEGGPSPQTPLENLAHTHDRFRELRHVP